MSKQEPKKQHKIVDWMYTTQRAMHQNADFMAVYIREFERIADVNRRRIKQLQEQNDRLKAELSDVASELHRRCSES